MEVPSGELQEFAARANQAVSWQESVTQSLTVTSQSVLTVTQSQSQPHQSLTVSDWVSEWLTQWLPEWVSQWMSHSMTHWLILIDSSHSPFQFHTQSQTHSHSHTHSDQWCEWSEVNCEVRLARLTEWMTDSDTDWEWEWHWLTRDWVNELNDK